MSREKTAFLVNISSVMLWCLIGIGIYADPLFEYVRMGLDIAGGQSVSAAEFLRTTIVFLYFPICITVVLMMSVFKLRDTGGMLKIEREQRKRCNVEQLKNIYKSETDRGEVGMVVVPLLLDVLAMLGTIAAGLETDVSMLISSGIFLISVTASVLAKRGIRILIGVLSIKINLHSADYAYFCLDNTIYSNRTGSIFACGDRYQRESSSMAIAAYYDYSFRVDSSSIWQCHYSNGSGAAVSYTG